MPGFRAGVVTSITDLESQVGGDVIDSAELATHAALPPDGGAVHGVGSVAANNFLVNVGGAWVTSLGNTAKAAILQATTYVRQGNTYLYGNIDYGGLTGGQLLLSSQDAPSKLMNASRTNTAANRAVVVGAGVAGTSPVLDVLTVGFWDTGGPTWYDLYKIKGDGLIQTDNVTSHHMAHGGKVIYDHINGRLSSGWRDAMGTSRSAGDLGTDGYTLSTPANTSITDDATDLTIHVDSGTVGDWYHGVYTAPNMRYRIYWTPSMGVVIYVHVAGIDTDNGNAGGMYLAEPGNNDKFLAIVVRRNAGAYGIYAHEDGGGGSASVGTPALTTGACWVGFRLLPANRYQPVYKEAAVGAEPGDDDWVDVVTSRAVPYTPDDYQFDVTLAGISWDPGGATQPGVDAEFKHLNIPR